MNKKPVLYLQTDSRWGHLDYSAKGESTTIGASGCGPTAMAMVLATWADKQVTPATECAWALRHGYKAPHQGTYYGYFDAAAKRYGLACLRLNWSTLYGNSRSACHAQAQDAVARGDLVIACMGPGNWTRSGHYVVLWDVQGDTACINDPASTKDSRTKGSWALFKTQVKYYWIITKPNHEEDKEDESMDIDALIRGMTDEQACRLVLKAEQHMKTLGEPEWSQKEGHWQRATEAGAVNGKNPEGFMRRDEMIAVLGRRNLL